MTEASAITPAFESPTTRRVADGPADPPTRHRIAGLALLTAVALGILGDVLLKVQGLGLNLTLWNVAAVCGIALVAHLRGSHRFDWRWLLCVPVLFFASVFTWRDAGPLLALNLLAMLTAYGVLALALLGWPGDVRRLTVWEALQGAVNVGISAGFGAAPLLLADGAMHGVRAGPRWTGVAAVVRGVLIAVPVLLVFGALLSAADARFERFLADLIDIDIARLVGHLVFAGFIAWITAGYLRGSLVSDKPLALLGQGRPPWRASLGIIELVVPLGLLNAMFLAFVVLQLPYLFGGASHIQQSAGLTVAAYARRGFFELLVVAALTLPLLLGASALVRRGSARHDRIFRSVATMTLVLLAVIMLSAMQRMRLYTSSFGLTEDRVYASAAMIWLAVVFLLFAATVLRGQDRGFAFASLVAGWLAIGSLDAINPQALIVRGNVERRLHGAEVDARYLTQLGADAVPALVRAMPTLGGAERCLVSKYLRRVGERRDVGLPEDWRWWNASRTRAFRLALDARPNLGDAECPEPAPPLVPGGSAPPVPRGANPDLPPGRTDG